MRISTRQLFIYFRKSRNKFATVNNSMIHTCAFLPLSPPCIVRVYLFDVCAILFFEYGLKVCRIVNLWFHVMCAVCIFNCQKYLLRVHYTLEMYSILATILYPVCIWIHRIHWIHWLNMYFFFTIIIIIVIIDAVRRWKAPFTEKKRDFRQKYENTSTRANASVRQ